MSPVKSPDRLIVALDLGTTFSGIGFAYSADTVKPDDVEVITTWPGGSTTSEKVPSEFAYESQHIDTVDPSTVIPSGSSKSRKRKFDETFELEAQRSTVNAANGVVPASSSQVRWGFQLKPHNARLRGLKLFLEPGNQLPSFMSRTDMEEQLRRSGKSAVTAIGDFLAELFKYAKVHLVSRYGSLFVETTPMEIILTVPAIWSDEAKNATYRAARYAGMGENIRMISEPEAAAIYTLQAMQPNRLRVGDTFVVCDPGGGTLDLISFEVVQTHPLVLREAAMGTGACCGSMFVDMRAEEYFRSRLGETKYRYIRARQPKTWLHATKHFEEYVKKKYDPTNPEEHYVPFPGVPDDENAGIIDGFLTMSSDDIGKLFKPIIDDATNLVEGQIDMLKKKHKIIRGIQLVGGFGQSKCLNKSLQDRFSNMASQPPYSIMKRSAFRAHTTPVSTPCIEIMQPSHPWTAVVRGAVLRGLEDAEIVLSRISNHHYGTDCQRPWNPQFHLGQERHWDRYEERYMVHDQMEWYISKGQDCSSTKPILFPFFSSFSSNAGQTREYDLIVCDEDVAPGVHKTGPKSVTRKICTLVVNLDPVPKRYWKQKKNSVGLIYYRLEFELGMQIESGGLRFDLRIDGIVYGDVVAEFHSS